MSFPVSSYSPTETVTDSSKNKRQERTGKDIHSYFIHKYCGVCGDIARSKNFGGECCNSCKAFFRRSINNNSYSRYYCPNKRDCSLFATNRKSCRYCRMKKCLAIGMRPEEEWIDAQRTSNDQIKAKEIGKNDFLWKYVKTASDEIVEHFSAKHCQPHFDILMTADFLTELEMREMDIIVSKYNQIPSLHDSSSEIQSSFASLINNSDLTTFEVGFPF